MSQQFVVFATPAFDHTLTLGYFKSAYLTNAALDKAGILHGYYMLGGDPYLAKVRNLLVEHCLRSYPTMTDFFFVDADVEWDPAGVLKLLEAPHDVVCGIYPKKNDITEFPCDLDFSTGALIEKDGFYKAIHVPTGFLRIKRHVLEKMIAVEPTYDDGTGNLKAVHNVFEMGFSGERKPGGTGKWWGEDYAWSEKWLAMGGEIWVYPDIQFGHRGQKTWHANFNDSLKAYHEGQAKIVDTGEGATPDGEAAYRPAANGSMEAAHGK